MAKKNVELKAETLRRIRAIIEECGGVKKIKPNQLRNHKQYITLHKNFMNGFERRISDEVIGYIYDGKTDDEIQLIYKELRESIVEEMSDEKTAKIVDEMEQATEEMFVMSKNKVVEGPIIIDTTAESVEDDAEESEDVKGLFGKFVKSTVEAGLKEVKDAVEEVVNDITKEVAGEVNESKKPNGMLILSKGAVVTPDGKTEKISDDVENKTDKPNDAPMTHKERHDMLVAKYRQPLIDSIGEDAANYNLTPPVNWDRVMELIENGPFRPGKFLAEGVVRGLGEIVKPILSISADKKNEISA